MNKRARLSYTLLVVILLLACNLPSNAPADVSATFAAQTVEALLSATPIATLTASPVPIETATATLPSIVTNTPIPSATPICNLAHFIADVTIPDGTVMAPNQTFNKKWRLRNTGVCTWNGYSLVFDSGESMSGPASKPIPAVAPGQEVDLDVDLKAPATPGTYRGYWRIVTNHNVLVPVVNGYQGRAFYVEIKVQASPTITNTSSPTITNTPPPASTTVTLTRVAGESGQVRSDGTVLNAVPNTGDTEGNVPAQAFLSFDMTSIPAGATITKVVVDFSSYDTLGNPWSLGNDGCARAYVQNYGTLDAADFFPGDPTGAVTRWCGAAQLSSVFEDNDMKAAVQSAVGSPRLQLRVQFRLPTTNGNGIADMIRFGAVKLIVTYQ